MEFKMERAEISTMVKSSTVFESCCVCGSRRLDLALECAVQGPLPFPKRRGFEVVLVVVVAPAQVMLNQCI